MPTDCHPLKTLLLPPVIKSVKFTLKHVHGSKMAGLDH